MPLQFERDPAKARTNHENHGVTFVEACTAFQDALSLTVRRPLHSDDEARFVLLGSTEDGKLLVVVHPEREGRIRIIRAREATNKERRHFEEGAE